MFFVFCVCEKFVAEVSCCVGINQRFLVAVVFIIVCQITVSCKRVQVVGLRVKLHMPNFQGPLITGVKAKAKNDATVSVY